MINTVEEICKDLGVKLTEKDCLNVAVFLLEFEGEFNDMEYVSSDNIRNIHYVFFSKTHKLLFYPHDEDRMIIFINKSNKHEYKQFDARGFEVVQIQSLLREYGFQLNLSQKINEMFIQDYNYSFDSKTINKEGYESYIFKSETDTHEYMLIITPEDKEKTLIEYMHPKGKNRRSFEEITRSDGSLYSIT